jgi:hypothetical protein
LNPSTYDAYIYLLSSPWLLEAGPELRKRSNPGVGPLNLILEIFKRSVGSGDLLINDFGLSGPDAEFFSVENISNCTSGMIDIDEACTVEVVLKREDFATSFIEASLHIHHNGAYQNPYEVEILAGKRPTSIGAIINSLLLVK